MRGATRHRRCCTRSSRFQSTHPVRGATVDEIAFKVGDVHFNPRTPCGVRLRSGIPAIASGTFQSTHPVRGATRTQSVRRCCKCNFNPRTPCGVRRCRSRPTRRSRRTFQSTHPVRGATRSRAEDQAGQEISIHAPRAGCDAARRTLSAVSAHFNPRTPCGVRRRPPAPSPAPPYFNPRTPCGVRREECCLCTIASRFQSTHPVRGATRPGEDFLLLRKFQSTHPVRGATPPEYDRP